MKHKLDCYIMAVMFGGIFNICFSAAERYKENSPLFYAIIAEVSYEKHKHTAQAIANQLLSGKSDTCSVVAHKEYESILFGNTTFIAVKDKNNGLHVGIEGSNEALNWVGNELAPINGFFHKNDVPEKTRNAMHDMIKKWVKKYGTLVSVVGHSRGGMFASQIAVSHKDFYKAAQIITFNGYKIKKGANQLHLLVKNEHAVSLVTSSGRYVQLPIGSAHHKILSNHKMGPFLHGLKDKDWKYIENHKK